MQVTIKDNDKVWFAFSTEDDMSDSAPSEATNRENVPFRVINKENGEIAFFSDCVPGADMFLYDDEFWNREITPDSIVADMIPEIGKRFEENKLVVKDRWQTAMVISQGNRIFDVSACGVYRETDMACHGVNARHAYARLKTTEGKDTIERIKDVFLFQEDVNRRKYFPIVVVDNESCEMHVIEKENAICH